MVSTNGFAFGQGTVTYNGDVSLGSHLTITDPYVTLTDFQLLTGASTQVSLGGFTVGAAALALSATDNLQATGKDVSGTVAFDPSGAVSNVTFAAGSLTANLGKYVTLSGKSITFNPTASGSETVLSADSLSASVDISAVSLALSGTATNISLSADGTVTGPSSLVVNASFNSATISQSLKLPPVLTLDISSVKVDFPHFDTDPTNFTITVSASVDSDLGPVHLSGSVNSLVIDPNRLADGQFPITSLAGVSVSASGNLFGGTISGALVAGVIETDATGQLLPANTPNPAHTIFWGGVEGSFKFGNIGASIYVGFSQYGLISAYLDASAPIILDPDSGLELSGFRGGVSFNALPLPVPTDPGQLNAPAFEPTSSLQLDTWEAQLQQEVINQATSASRLYTLNLDQANSITQLDSGSIAPTDSFALESQSNGYPIADSLTPTTVTALSTDHSLWMVTHGSDRFFVHKNDSGNLDVTGSLFVVTDQTATDLGLSSASGAVSSALIQAFQNNNVTLSASATVSDIRDDADGNPVQWQIDDNGQVYYITTKGSADSQTVLAITQPASISQMNAGVVRIEAGATLSDAYAANQITGDVDVIITTDGRFLIAGKVTLANKLSADLKIFGDLSSLNQANPNTPLSLSFLADLPAPDPASDIPPLLELKGTMKIEFLDANGALVNPALNPNGWTTFVFDLQGQADIGNPDGLAVVIGGSAGSAGGYAEIKLSVTQDAGGGDTVELDASGSLSIEGVISAGDLVSAAGKFILQTNNSGNVELYGAAKLDFNTDSPGLSFLTEAGLSANADLTLALNTSATAQTVALDLPGRAEESFSLAPTTVEIDGTGSILFNNSALGIGANVSVIGAFSINLSSGFQSDNINNAATAQGHDTTDTFLNFNLFVDGNLNVSLSGGGQTLNFLTLSALGLLVVRDLDISDPSAMRNPITGTGGPIVPELGGLVDLFIERSVPGVFSASGSAQLLLNTTGSDITYQIPASLLDTVRNIEAHRQNTSPSNVSTPALPALTQNADGTLGGSISIPGSTYNLEHQKVTGPYFSLQFGDPTTTDSNTAPGFDLTILDTIKLDGSFRIVAAIDQSTGAPYFGMAVDATASLAIPNASNILNAEAIGILEFSPDGLFGALGFSANLALPGNALTFNTIDYIGINTTTSEHNLGVGTGTLSHQVIPAHSGEIYLNGNLQVGALDVKGQFDLLVGTQSLQLNVNGSIIVNGNAILTINGDAAIYFGLPSAQDGLVLNASAQLGNGSPIGVKHIFELGGDFTFHLDTRPASPRIDVSVSNASVSILDALNFSGSADISFQNNEFTVSGSFSGSFLGVFNVSASGWFNSQGYFDLNLAGNFSLGDHTFGIDAAASFEIAHTTSDTLSFSGSAQGNVYGFGIDLAGANVGLSYDSNSGTITASATVTVIGISGTVSFDIGGLSIPTDNTPPPLASQSGGTLTLTNNPSGSNSYAIDSLGAGSSTGEKIVVRSGGRSQTFDNVTEIDASFGSGSNDLQIGMNVGLYDPALVINASSSGTTRFSNLSPHAAVNFDASTSSAANTLSSRSPNSTLQGGSGPDSLIGTSGDTLIGGPDANNFTWNPDSSALALPTTIRGSGADSLTLNGTSGADTFSLSDQNSQTALLSSTLSGVASSLQFQGINSLTIHAGDGQNSAQVDTTGLASTGLDAISIDLNPLKNHLDSATILGTPGADTFSLGASGSNVSVSLGSLTITDLAPTLADHLTLDGNGGSDTFSIPSTGASDPGHLLQLTLDASHSISPTDQNIFNLPDTTSASLLGGSGTNTAHFSIDSTTPVTLSSSSLRTPSSVIALAGIPNVTLAASAPVPITVQSTPSGTTRIAYSTPGGSLDIQGASAPVNITLDGSSSVLLEAATAPVSISGTSSQNDTVTLGSGLLSAITSAVSINNVDNVIYNDSLDPLSRNASISASTLTNGGLAVAPLLSGVSAITYQTGMADTSLSATLGTAAITLLGGPATDTLSALLTAPVSASTKPITAGANVDHVLFTDQATSTTSSYLLNADHLSLNSTLILNASSSLTDLALHLNNGTHTLSVGAVDVPTTINLGSGVNTITVGDVPTAATPTNLNDVQAPLILLSSGTQNSLTLDDRSLDLNTSRSVLQGFASSGTASASINFSGAGIASLTDLLGSGTDALSLSNLPAQTTIDLGSGSETISASNALNNLSVIAPSTGTAALSLQSASGSVLFDTSAAVNASSDSLSLDASGSLAPVSGSLAYSPSGSEVLLSLNDSQHTLATTLSTTSPLGQVSVTLGAGNDTFSINLPSSNTPFANLFNLSGGPGNDTITASATTPATLFNLSGGSGTDQLRVSVSSPSTSFTNISPSVETLTIDGSQDTQPVDWKVNGSEVSLSPQDQNTFNPVLNTTGADTVSFLGGSSNLDTLSVSGNNPAQPISAVINGASVNVTQGVAVLSQTPKSTLSPASGSASLNGLTGANQVVSTPDGSLVFASGSDRNAGLVIYRRNLTSNTLVILGSQPIPNGVAALAISPDGSTLFVASAASSSPTVYAFSINSTNGSLKPITSDANLANPISQILLSPNGQTLLIVDTPTSSNRQATLLPWNATSGAFTTSGALSVSLTPTVGSLSFSSDSSEFFAPDTAGLLTIYSTASAAPVASYNTATGLQLDTFSEIQVSADGKLLLAYHPASSPTDSYLAYYRLPDTASGRMTLLGKLPASQMYNYADTTANVFAYNNATGQLVTLDYSYNQDVLTAYLWNASTDTFNLQISHTTNVASQRSLSVVWPANVYTGGLVAVSGLSLTGVPQVSILDLYTNGFIDVRSEWIDSNPSDLPYPGIVQPVLDPVSKTASLFLVTHVQSTSQYQAPSISFLNANQGLFSLTLLDPRYYGVSFPEREAILDVAVRQSPSGPTSSWYTLVSYAGLYYLQEYALQIDPTSGQVYTQQLFSVPTSNLLSFTPYRIACNPSGSDLVLTDFGGHIARYPLDSAGNLITSGLRTSSVGSPAYTPTAFSVATTSGNIYSVSDSQPDIEQYTLSSGSSSLFDPASTVGYYNGLGAFSGENAVIPLPDNQTFLLADNTGNLLVLDTKTETRAAAPFLAYYTGFGGSNATSTFATLGSSVLWASSAAGLIQTQIVGTGAQRVLTLAQETPQTTSDLFLSSSTAFVTSSSASSLASIPLSGTTLETASLASVSNASPHAFSGVQSTSLTPDGSVLYGVSPTDGAFTAINLATSESRSYFNRADVSSGLSGNLLVTSLDLSGQPIGLVVSPSDGSITTVLGLSLASQYLEPASANPPLLKGASAIAASSGLGVLFVASGGTVSAWAVQPSGQVAPLSGTLAMGDTISLMQFANGLLYLYDATSKTLNSYTYSSTSGFSPVGSIALPPVTTLAFAAGTTQTDLYATTSEPGGHLYHLIDTNGSLSLAPDSYQDGQNAVQGLSGATSLALSSDNSELFVASPSTNSVSAFSRDPSTGTLTFLEFLANGRGASGLNDPSSLAVSGSSLLVASGAPQYGVPGGIVPLNILPLASAHPFHYATTFQNIASLTLNGGTASDALEIDSAPPVSSLTLNGNGGGDQVSLNALNAGTSTVNLADGASTLNVNLQSLPTADPRTLLLNAGTGQLSAHIAALGDNTTATLNVDQGTSGPDITTVSALGIPSSSSLTVNGVAKANGPVLIDYGQSSTLSLASGSTTTGQITDPNLGPILFNNLEAQTGQSIPQQVFTLSAPKPTITLPSTFHEGDSLSLSASDLGLNAGDTYAWDLSGNGQFTDASGASITLSWTQLQALGITSAGAYPIAVQVTNTQNTQNILGAAFQASAVASGTLQVLDTPPTISLPSGSPTLGVPFSLALAATDPGHEPITSWTVNWGDNTALETLGASATSATHVYTSAGTVPITLTAHQNALATSTAPTALTVLPGSGSVSLPTLNPIHAGDTLNVSASVFGTPTDYTWTLSGPGGSSTFSTSTPTLSEPWSALGLVDGGTYTVALVANYQVNGSSYSANAFTSLSILDIAPSGTLSASAPAIPQGSPSGSVTLSVSSITDPAPGSTNPAYTVAYDFNNDGTLDTGFVSVDTPEPISAANLLTPGTHTIRAVLQAPNGLTRDLFTTLSVSPVAPTLQLTTPAPALEGSPVTLSASASGIALSVSQWQIQWGDGQIDTIPGNGSLSQTFTHTYANNLPNNAPYPITVSADTTSGSASATSLAVVSDVAPVVSLSTPTPSVVLGQPDAFTLNLSVTDPGADVVSSYTIAWGDGHTQTVPGSVSTITHTYNTLSVTPIQVTSLTNNDGTFTNPSNALPVTITDPAPTLVSALSTFPANGAQGTPVSLSAVATSVQTGSEPLTFTWTITDPSGTATTLTSAVATPPRHPRHPPRLPVRPVRLEFLHTPDPRLLLGLPRRLQRLRNPRHRLLESGRRRCRPRPHLCLRPRHRHRRNPRRPLRLRHRPGRLR